MGVPARNAVYASPYKLGKRLVLIGIAEHSTSEHSPFEAWCKVPAIAHVAGMSDRQTQRYIAELKREGVIEAYQRDRYTWGYRINVPEVSVDVTPQEPGTTHDVTPDILEVSVDVTPDYPYGVTHDVTPDTKNGRRGVTLSHRGVTSEYSGVTLSASRGDTFALAYKERKKEREEREEKEGDARTRDPIPSPSSVMSADQAFQTLLAYLEGEVSDHERRTWRERIRAGWSGPDVLCLRGPASLVRLPRFTGCMRMAAKQVEMGAVIEFSVIGS